MDEAKEKRITGIMEEFGLALGKLMGEDVLETQDAMAIGMDLLDKLENTPEGRYYVSRIGGSYQ